MKDYYSILGVSKGCSQKEIQKAFRTLAQKHHPDKKGGDSKKFKEINEAYQVLNNPQRRAQYDATGQAPPGGGQGGFNQQGGFAGFDFSQFNMGGGGGFEDIIREMFHGARNQGAHVQINIHITFEESVFGVTKQVSIPYRQKKTETVSIPIPAGVEDGTQLQVRGRGEPAKDAKYPPGDLIVAISVERHKIFRRHRGELIYPLDITVTEALLGVTKEIRDLKGEALTVPIPKLTKQDDTIVIEGRGIPRPHGTGRLIVLCKIVYPKNLTSKAKELIEQLKKEGV